MLCCVSWRWRVSPEIGVAYGHEAYDTYTNSLGQAVDGASVSIGRMTGGVELAYQMRGGNGTTVEPMIGVEGIWNFDSDDLEINGVVQQSAESRAKVEGGIQISTPSGWGVRAAASYDGLGGGDFQSAGWSVWVNVPLN